MFIAVFIVTTMMYGEVELEDPQGAVDTVEECKQRLALGRVHVVEASLQYGLQGIKEECRNDDSKAI